MTTQQRAHQAWTTLLAHTDHSAAPPATDAALDTLARLVGRALPEPFCAVYQAHDGGAARILPEGAWMRSLDEIARDWQFIARCADEMWEDLDGVRQFTADGTHLDAPYDRSWLPFGTRGDFDLFIDLAPGPAGTYGQVLLQINEASTAVLGRDLLSFLERWAEILEGSLLVRVDGIDYPVPAHGASFVSLFAVGVDPLAHAALTAPHGDPALAVFGDRLMADGDRRGALVSASRRVRAAPDDPAAQEALKQVLAEHEAEWCPGCLDPTVALTWDDAFVDTVAYRPPYDEDYNNPYSQGPDDERLLHPGAAVIRLLDLPSAARIRSLSMDAPLYAEGNHGCWSSHEHLVAALLARPRPHLHALELEPSALRRGLSHGAAVPELSQLKRGAIHEATIDYGDLSALWTVAPHLEHLVIGQCGTLELGNIDAPYLRTLVIGDISAVGAIMAGKLPVLSTLAVRVRDADAVRALLASEALRTVRALGLVWEGGTETQWREDLPASEAVLQALLASDRLENIEVLDLGGLVVRDEAWEELIAAKPRMPRLQELRLSSWRPGLDNPAGVADWIHDLDHDDNIRDPLLAPHRSDIGQRLASALPIRWLYVRAMGLDEYTGDWPPSLATGECYGLWRDVELFVEG